MALISVSIAYTARLQYWIRVSRGMPDYSRAFAGNRLYCLVTEAHGCK